MNHSFYNHANRAPDTHKYVVNGYLNKVISDIAFKIPVT